MCIVPDRTDFSPVVTRPSLWEIALVVALFTMGFRPRRLSKATTCPASPHPSLDNGRGRLANSPSDIPSPGWKDIRHPEAGGAESVTHELMRRLAADEHEVTLVTARYPGSAERDEIDGVRIRRVGNRVREAEALDATGVAYRGLDRAEDAVNFHRMAVAFNQLLARIERAVTGTASTAVVISAAASNIRFTKDLLEFELAGNSLPGVTILHYRSRA